MAGGGGSGTGVTVTDTLPAAGVTLRGHLYLITGAAGVADEFYVCVKTDADVYEWSRIVWGP
jgi:hypothetical protein